MQDKKGKEGALEEGGRVGGHDPRTVSNPGIVVVGAERPGKDVDHYLSPTLNACDHCYSF